jgi:glycosyltransferase involved in cell wall biosynthesis
VEVAGGFADTETRMNGQHDPNPLRPRSERIVSMQTTSERGGAEYANVDLLEALAERGYDIVLLTNLPEIAANTRFAVREIDLGPKLSRRTLLRLALRAPLLLTRVAGALRAARPIGTLVLHFKKEQLLCSLLPRRLTGRIVWAEWGPLPAQMRRGPGRWVYALAARRVSRVMAISAGTQRTVVEAGVPAFKVEVIPTLVDVEHVRFDPASRVRLREQWGVSEETLVVGCMSRFQRRKRNDVLIDSAAHLDGDVLLILAGEGEQEGLLRDRATPYGDRVRFAPNVRGHAEAFLSACDLLVFAPSPTEGEPRSIVMAQLVGVPVIATDAEGTESLIEEGGGAVVSPPHDPLALAALIDAYRADPARRLREGYTAREKAIASHDPEQTLDRIEALLGVSRHQEASTPGGHSPGSAAHEERREDGDGEQTRLHGLASRTVRRLPSTASGRRSLTMRKRR